MIEIPTVLEQNRNPLPKDWEATHQEAVEAVQVQQEGPLVSIRLTSEKQARTGRVQAPIRKHLSTTN